MKGDPLPDADRVARFCRRKNHVTEKAGRLEILGEAFEPRQDEQQDGISVVWVEFLPGDAEQRLAHVRRAISLALTVRRGHYLAVVGVGAIRSAGREFRTPLDVVHDPILDPPEKANPAHALVTGLSLDDRTLQERIALEAIAVSAAVQVG